MLALLLPWRDLQDIKGQYKTFQVAFEEFIETASQHDLDIISGIQYYYDCKNAAGTCQDKALPVLHHTGRGQTCAKEVLAQDKEDPEMDIDSDANIQLTEADLHVFEEVQKKP